MDKQELFLEWVDNTISTYEDAPIEVKYGSITVPVSMLQELRGLVDKLIKQNEQYEKSLKFYADKENYEEWDGVTDLYEYIHNVDFDGGDKARITLELTNSESYIHDECSYDIRRKMKNEEI